MRLRAVNAVLLVVAGKLGLVVIYVALILVAVHTVLVQVLAVVLDIALIGVAIRTILRQILLIVSNVFLVVVNVLLLRSRILALCICITGEQTGKSNREHPSTDHQFCVHCVLSYGKRSWRHHHTYKSQTPRALQSFATPRSGFHGRT